MGDHRTEIVKRVMHSLEETYDPDSLVWAYFDRDRDAVIEAAQQTLEATREDASRERVEAAVDRELIEALRFPTNLRQGLLPRLYIRRGRVAAIAAVVIPALYILAQLLL